MNGHFSFFMVFYPQLTTLGERLKKAKVFLVEDNPSLQDIIKIRLEMAGHEVVLIAGRLVEALSMASSGRLKASGANVAIVDGMLREGQRNPGETLHGALIADQMNNVGANIPIIAFTSYDEVTAAYGDRYLFKDVTTVGIKKLLAMIEEVLPEQHQ